MLALYFAPVIWAFSFLTEAAMFEVRPNPSPSADVPRAERRHRTGQPHNCTR